MVRTSGATSSTGGQLRVTLSTTLPIGCSLNHVSTSSFLIILKRDGGRRAQNNSNRTETPLRPDDHVSHSVIDDGAGASRLLRAHPPAGLVVEAPERITIGGLFPMIWAEEVECSGHLVRG